MARLGEVFFFSFCVSICTHMMGECEAAGECSAICFLLMSKWSWMSPLSLA